MGILLFARCSSQSGMSCMQEALVRALLLITHAAHSFIVGFFGTIGM